MRPLDLVVIGTSLGGLDALTRVLGALPATFPQAVAVVQHRRPDGDTRLARILGGRCRIPVAEVEDRTPVEAGRVFIAPADYHLLVHRGAFELSVDPPVSFSRPAIDVLFESAADAYGSGVMGILLTAASHDGARGLAAIAKAGGLTVVQDPAGAESPIAPRAALARMKPDHVLSPEGIAALLADPRATRRRSG